MPTNRTRRSRQRIDLHVPEWALRLLEGHLPERGSEDDHQYFGWWAFGDRIPGLPDADSLEAREIVARADANNTQT
jgi:hypothetical protein